MQPAPASASTSSRPLSIQRSKIEYDGWEISSGAPRSARMAAASRVLDRGYDEMPAYRALPRCTAVASAPSVSSMGVSASKRWE